MDAFIQATLGQWELLLRLLASCFCGAAIGWERSYRQKEAGLRTHIILALGAALVMLVSKYGFAEIPDTDGSRIASNVVTGIGFLGAGVIFVRGNAVKGLTTAAGLFTTAGIGLALGAGQYTLGIFCTLLMLALQIGLHHFSKALPAAESTESIDISLTLTGGDQSYILLKDRIEAIGACIAGVTVKKDADGILHVHMSVRVLKDTTEVTLLSQFEQQPSIRDFSLTR